MQEVILFSFCMVRMVDYIKIESQPSDLLKKTYDELVKEHKFDAKEQFSIYMSNAAISEMKKVSINLTR